MSDTHIPGRAKVLPPVIYSELAQADYIIHAGDFVSPDIIEILLKYGPVTGVAGNNDDVEVVAKFGYKQIIRINNFKIGVIHGDRGQGRSTLEKALNSFDGTALDLLIFGHSHLPYLQQHGWTWVINPGSPTDRRRNNNFSYAVVEAGEKISPELIYFR